MRKESAIIKKIGSMENGGKDGKSKGQIEMEETLEKL